FAEAAFIEPIEMDGAHRAAVLRQRLGGGAALRGDEIAHGFAGEIRLARKLREIGGNARTAAGGADSDDGEQLVARPRIVELQLAVLIDRPERGDWRCA